MRLLIGFLAAWWSAVAAPPAHVIFIGVDGMGAEGVTAMRQAGRVPNLEALMKRGAWTLKARVVMPSVSSPNWASAIMGAGPEQHGITSNNWERDKFTIAPVCKGSEDIFPSLVGTWRAARPKAKIAVIHDWDGFGRLVEKSAATLVEPVKGGAQKTMDRAVEYWKRERPELMLVHLDDVDHAGHEHEWRSAKYLDAIAEADGQIGQMVRAVTEAGQLDRTLFVVLADHGGVGKKHGGESMAEVEIPWMLAGPGVANGRQILEPVSIIDTATTIAHVSGVKVPDCWIGRVPRSALR